MARSERPRSEPLIKAVMLGDPGVGKSNLLLRAVDDTFSPAPMWSIGIDFKTKRYDDLGVYDASGEAVTVRAQFWDNDKQERYNSVMYRAPSLFYVVYDVTNRDSFEHVKRRLATIISEYGRKDATIVLIGNKADEVARKVVFKKEGEALAEQYRISFFETSAKSGANVSEAFRQGLTDAARRQISSPAFLLPSAAVPQRQSTIFEALRAIGAIIAWPFKMLVRKFSNRAGNNVVAAVPVATRVAALSSVDAGAIHRQLKAAESTARNMTHDLETERKKTKAAQAKREKAEADRQKADEARIKAEAKLREMEARVEEMRKEKVQGDPGVAAARQSPRR